MVDGIKEEVVRTVTRSFLGQTTTEDTTLEVRPFVTEPARISVKKGCPVDMGGRDRAWIGVEISMPCYREELEEVFPQVSSMVDDCLEYELNKLKGDG